MTKKTSQIRKIIFSRLFEAGSVTIYLLNTVVILRLKS